MTALIRHHIPFEAINATLLANSLNWLREEYPRGKLKGREFTIGNLQGDPGDSMSINIDTGKWADFEANVSGRDLLSLYAARYHNMDRFAAGQDLGVQLGLMTQAGNVVSLHRSDDQGVTAKPEPSAAAWIPHVPAPRDAPAPNVSGWDHVYPHYKADGDLIRYIVRNDARGEQKKKVLPLTHGILNGKVGWHHKHAPAPRDLFGIDRLHSHPESRVWVLFGEKKTMALQALIPDQPVISWTGGDKAVGKTEWSDLRGKEVIIWPDADESGAGAANEIGSILRKLDCKIWVIDVSDMPEKWDAGDAIDDGWNAEEIMSWVEPRLMLQHDPSSSAQQRAGNDKTNTSEEHKKKNTNSKIGSGDPAISDRVDDVLREFNPKYAVVNEYGKVIIYCPKWDEQLKRNILERIQFEDFRRMYMNRRVQVGVSSKGNPVYSDVGTVWLEHYNRRQYLGGVVMDPLGRTPPDCWNLWQGFAVQPAEGNWSLMRRHIQDVICGGDSKLFDYVLGWLARMVQQPDRPGEVALVLRGKKGTGKGTLGNWLVRLLGQHSIHVAHAKHLVGNFNAHLRDAVFVFADEAFWAGDKSHEGALKALVTEPVITIEAKYQNPVTIANMTHILMASNSDWVVPASGDERRFCVMDVLDKHIQDTEYFGALNQQMDAGGLAAMLHDLLKYDITNFNVRSVPQTTALADQKRLSMDSLHRWWATVLEREYVYRSRFGASVFLEWRCFVTTQLLDTSYRQWCTDNREGRPMSREQLGAMMKALYKPCRPQGFHPVFEVEVMDQEGKPAVLRERPPGYLIGSIHEARAAFVNKTGISFDWGDDDDTSDTSMSHEDLESLLD